MEAGVRLADPARFDVRGELRCGSDVEIDVNCVFEGRVALGDGVRIGAHCVIRDATHRRRRGDPSVHAHRRRRSAIGAGALIGPFARLRPGAELGDEVHIGNFVEVKNSTLARGAKANHLAYLGDATVGERVNYGAGSITANYDGANKHRTVIGDDVHVGSNCVLVAPVTIGDGATIGGGSTISKDAPAGQLTVARAQAGDARRLEAAGQESEEVGWRRGSRHAARRCARQPAAAKRSIASASAAPISVALQLVAAERGQEARAAPSVSTPSAITVRPQAARHLHDRLRDRGRVAVAPAGRARTSGRSSACRSAARFRWPSDE